MNLRKAIITAVAILATIPSAYAFSIVGSSTVFPFASSVAEIVGQNGVPTPIVESTGTGGGFKIFCGGIDINTPSIANASRPIKDTELKACQDNGVTPVGFTFGKDSIVIAYSSQNTEDINFTPLELYLAVAANVPVNGQLVPNPYTKWSQINPTLPDRDISIMGPPQTSGTRDAFLSLAINPGCKEAIKDLTLDADTIKRTCEDFRTDGAWIDSGENDNLLVKKLEINPDTFAIFGYYYLENNLNEVKGASINGVVPTYDTAIDGTYALTRDLYVYAKKEHVGNVVGLVEFLTEILSEEASGADGYLEYSGLIVNPEDVRNEQRLAISTLTN